VSGSTHKLRLVSREAETTDVASFTFEVLAGSSPVHRAGQAMTLVLELDGQPALRTFSLASPPMPNGHVTMTVKAQSGSGATRWMHDHLQPGTVVEARGPHGRFVLPEVLPDRLALVSAGSGASPLMAMLREIATTAPDTDAAWVHAARGAGDILFAAELARLQASMPRLAVSVALSQPAPGWFGYRGRLTRRLLAAAVPDFGRRTVFCCGPQSFMEATRLIHAAEGGSVDTFHIEHFGAALPRGPEQSRAFEFTGNARRVSMGDKNFTVEPGETILQAATRQVVVIPCGCASGLCGTCRTRLVEGKVEMQHQGGLAPEEEAAGFILACSARPLTDLVLAS
jgi:glycine betaine catabolism B